MEEPKGKKGITAIIVAVLALLTTFLTNLDRVTEAYEKYIKQNKFVLEGQWNGVHQYPKFEGNTDKVIEQNIQLEIINISGTDSKVSGYIDHNVLGEHWNVSGVFRNDILILTYLEKRQEVNSVGTVVVESKDVFKKTYVGYWLGVHEHGKRLVACPYVMTKDDFNNAKIQHKEFLHQPCSVRRDRL